MALVDFIRRLVNGTTVIIRYGEEESPLIEGMDPGELYATQANLHAVVSFLSDSISQLPLKVYRRVEENKRERVRDSVAAKLLYRPNADQTQSEFLNSLAIEYFIYGVITIWLAPDKDSDSGWQMRLIPHSWIRLSENKASVYALKKLVFCPDGQTEVHTLDSEHFSQFKMYSPGNPDGWESPCAALRQVLSEQIKADKFRTQLWNSSGRFNSYVSRPKDVQPWDEKARDRFVEAFRSAWRGDGEKAGSTPVLEDGMKIETYQFNAKEAQYVETKQLSREDVAAAYHVNPALIWHTGTQTYASAKDNARALYAECLGPTLQMIQQRFVADIFPKIGADPNEYCEFDYTEKLKGSFEERAAMYQAAVGGPYLTIDEVRTMENKPPLPDGLGDQIIRPLNVLYGGQASPQDTHMEANKPAELVPLATETQENAASAHAHGMKAENTEKPDPLRIKARSDADEEERLADTLATFFKRQKSSVLARLGADAEDWWNADRWNAELADDLESVLNDIADRHGKATARELKTEYDTAITRNYIRATAEWRARATNDVTKRNLDAALAADDDDEDAETPADVMDKRVNDEAPMLARSAATAMASWATIEGCHQAQAQGYRGRIEKEWHTGSNPRPAHAAMDGERVDIDDTFSNGARWPGDDNVGPEESCNCNCETEVIITTA